MQTAGFEITERTIQHDLGELPGVFPMTVDDREKPNGWSWQKNVWSFDLPGITIAGDTVVNITVNQSGGESQSSSGTNNDARALAGKIKGVVLEVITTEKRPGGLLYQ